MKLFWKLIGQIILNLSFLTLLVGAGPIIETLPKIGTVNIKMMVQQPLKEYEEESLYFDFDATHRMPIAESLGGIEPPGPNQRLEVKVWDDDPRNPQLLFQGIIRGIDVGAYEKIKLTVNRIVADEGDMMTWQMSLWRETPGGVKFYERVLTLKVPVKIFSVSTLPIELEGFYTEMEKNVVAGQRDLIVNLLINPSGHEYDALGQAKTTIAPQDAASVTMPVELFAVPLENQASFQADKPFVWGFDVVDYGDTYDDARGGYKNPPVVNGQIRGLTLIQGHPKASLYLADSAIEPAQVYCDKPSSCRLSFEYEAVEKGLLRIDYFGPSDDPNNEYKNWQAWDYFLLPASSENRAHFSQVLRSIQPEGNQGFFILRLFPKNTVFNDKGEALNRGQVINHWVQGFIRKIVVDN